MSLQKPSEPPAERAAPDDELATVVVTSQANSGATPTREDLTVAMDADRTRLFSTEAAPEPAPLDETAEATQILAEAREAPAKLPPAATDEAEELATLVVTRPAGSGATPAREDLAVDMDADRTRLFSTESSPLRAGGNAAPEPAPLAETAAEATQVLAEPREAQAKLPPAATDEAGELATLVVTHPAGSGATPAQEALTVATSDGQTEVYTGTGAATEPATLRLAGTPAVTATAEAPTQALPETHAGTVNLSHITTGGIAKTWLDTLAGENLTASSSLAPGQELDVGVVLKDRFVLKEMLGKGGMGSVFKALDLRKVEANDREPFVALKVLNQDFRDNPVSLIALQRETKRAQTLSHPNIITVYDFDRDGAYVFMTMEHLQGRPLNHVIRELKESGMPFKKAWPLIEGMGAALAYAHKKNIVHSDFKPGNVFVTQQGDAKVLDFGIATAIGRPEKGADATVFNARDLGAMTPAYASLEQLRHQPPDPRDDIYALACVAYELLTGKHPFGKLSAETALELKVQLKPIAGLRRNQWRALQRGLAFQQEDRIASVAEFLKLLQPHSKLFYSAWTAAALAAAITSGNLYFHFITPPAPPPPIAVEITPEQQRKIDDLLELAAIHFDVGYLTAPTGSNALWAYQEVLKIDPYNEKAINGIRKIADAEEQAAWEAYEKGDRAESLKRVLEGLDADPHHEGLLKLKSKLEG